MPIRFVFLVAVAFGLTLIMGCDAVPSTPDVLSVPPEINGLSYSPESVSLAATDPDLDQETISVPITLSVRTAGSGGELRNVAYVIQPPNPADQPIASGLLSATGAGVYTTSLTAEFPRGNVGKYTVLVFAVSGSGRMSNTLRGHINYVAEGSPPVIVEVIAEPDTIRVSRDNILVLTAIVGDPDGLENVSRVVVRTPNQQELQIYDDGVSRGDPVAGDGRYTARFEGVNQATPNTTQSFSFQAFDRTGLSSEIVEKAIRIEE